MGEVKATQLRPDLQAIAEFIPDAARVLDLGGGDGALLDFLVQRKRVKGRGKGFAKRTK